MTAGYDGADLSSVTDRLGRQAQYLTDALGRVIATTDSMGSRTIYDWDDLDRMTGTTDALGGITSFSYDAAGKLLSYTDAKGHTSGYEYNSLGKVQSFWDALFKVETRLYEPGGKVKQFIDRKGQLRSVTYDVLGRVKAVSFGATPAHPTAYKSQIENTWDAGNRLTQIVDKTCADPDAALNCSSVASTRTITRTYDGLDRKVSEVTPQGEVDYTFDRAGRRTTMIIKNGPPGSQVVQPTITYTYDNANRLTAIEQAAASINAGQPQRIAFAYDAAGQRTQTTLANGSTTTYTYDDAGEITAIVYKRADGTFLGDLQYEYDAAGRTASMAGSLAQLNLPAADITDATYDANNRLLTWGGKSYTYDDDGNLISDGTNTYQWNERNRLAAISNGASEIASFHYDSLGRRTAKTLGAQETGYLYDRANIAQELAGTTSAAPVKAHLLTAGIDDLYLRIEGSDGANRQSVFGDANNNTVMLLNAAQDSVTSYTYDPYGVTTASSASGNTHQYTGRENDNPGGALGLYYYRARYYIPGIARFISEDPIGWTSGQANNYAYVGGNPIDFRDPGGLDAADDFENFSAGFGDALMFGLTRWIRGKLGIDGVNTCSGWYTGGEVAGVVALTVATAGVGGEAGAAADGLEALAEEEAVAEGAAAEGAEQAPNAVNPSKQFNPDQRALVDLAKGAERTGVSEAEADTLLEWADEYGLPSRGPEVHPGRPFGQFPHIHIGPVNHIPVN
jgi:RHS repeat-associated protein